MTVPASHLLDTSVLSQPIKDRPLRPVLDRWSALGELAVCTSAICVAEILQGLETRASAKYWRRYRALLEDRYRVLPFDGEVAVTFARLGAQMASRGLPRPALDLMIAATDSPVAVSWLVFILFPVESTDLELGGDRCILFNPPHGLHVGWSE